KVNSQLCFSIHTSAQTVFFCVCVCLCSLLPPGHGGGHPCPEIEQHEPKPRGGWDHHQGACSQVSSSSLTHKHPKARENFPSSPPFSSLLFFFCCSQVFFHTPSRQCLPPPGTETVRCSASQVKVRGALLGSTPSAPINRQLLSVTLPLEPKPVVLNALLDTGAADNFVDQELANQLRLPTTELEHTTSVTSVDGRPRQPYPIRRQTQLLRMSVEENHETIRFLVISAPSSPLILGHSWFRQHNPHISWSAGRLLHWGPQCNSHRHHAPEMDSAPPPDTAPPRTKDIPTHYRDLLHVFDKNWAAALPPHHPYDMEILLQPGTTPPRGRLLSLAPSETRAMEDYVAEALAQGFIRPSTSPGAASFFFVKKEDGGLRPCIDYRGLNRITIWDRHPRPLVSTALDSISQAHFSTKLDLRRAYNLVKIKEGDEWKTAFITPTGHWEYLVMPLTALQSSRGSLTRFSETCWVARYSRISTTFLSTPRPRQTMYSMYGPSSPDSSRTDYTANQRSVPFTKHPSVLSRQGLRVREEPEMGETGVVKKTEKDSLEDGLDTTPKCRLHPPKVLQNLIAFTASKVASSEARGELVDSLQKQHEQECTTRGKMFQQGGELSATHASNPHVSSADTGEDSDDILVQRPYLCRRCGKIFQNLWSYVGHLKEHTQYSCLICGQLFSQKNKLSRHMRVHAIHKPFGLQAAQWTEFLSCPICYNEFDSRSHQPISLGCSHTVCKTCLHKLHRKACPFDQTPISTDIDLLPVNCALLQLVGALVPDVPPVSLSSATDVEHYEVCRLCVEELALYLKPISSAKAVANLTPSMLSRPMQRKLVTLVNCQLVEEEGRVRAVRAARSLGERTVTELILQHQNPQQLSANLWAAVRARGCQFLGPAMQEDALKLVLLALEDGSALSRKVLVLFVVQKLEARFPQASKTSIGHVVQLLYRASCFKVTKRDEDSSLMQLKEEFRTYEALRREHDAQTVHIAMEAGLRISPEQWSSLLYGDLVHKSHMQSIIDKLQSPESFAKSVQELTIVLQRTGDPANLTSLRPHLELLANIDHNPDAPVPSWAELESVMQAVKLVVHGLVEFMQNFSKKSHDTPQPQVNSKYKTSMCRDLRQQGGCPRGTNCTFAHTQDELEKFRLKNKKSSSSVVRAFPSAGKGISDPTESSAAMTEGVAGLSHPQLIPRGSSSTIEEGKRALSNGTSGINGSNGLSGTNRNTSGSTEQKPISPARPPVSLSSGPPPFGAAPAGADGTAPVPRHGQFILSSPHPPQVSELYYQESHPAYDTAHYQPTCSYYQSTLHPSHKPCMARFLRSANVSESSLPPSAGYSYPTEPQMPHLPSSSSSGYPAPPHRDRIGAPAFHPHPGQPQYGPLTPAHGVYAPLYDSRRVWRPQLYHREDARSNSLPPEVLRSSVYQPPLRERFNSLDNYCSGAEHHAALHRDFGRVPLGYEGLYKRKQDQWTSIHHHHNPSRPSQSSPIFTDFGAEHVESSGGQCMGCRIRNEESLAHYSPWSYGSTGSSLSPFEPEALTHTSAHSCSKHPELDGTEGEAVSRKQWLHTLDNYRRLKEEDPIIPFSEAPIISKWGAISRASRTAYHNTDPVQATSCQGGANTTPINFKDYNHHLDHGDYRWGSRGSDSSSHSSFLESEHLCTSELDGRRTSISGEKIVSDLQVRHPTFSQDRNQAGGEQDPDRDIELELSALDLEDSDQHETNLEESLNLHSPPSQDASHLLPPPCSSPLCSSPVDEHSKTQRLTTEKVDPHLLKKMAFRKSMSPGGLASGGLGIGKLVLRTGPPQLGNASNRVCSETPGTEMLLSGSSEDTKSDLH
ncbi:roquin-2-like, partial [Nothobranchius furzeri]